jgi:hypothetical protein
LACLGDGVDTAAWKLFVVTGHHSPAVLAGAIAVKVSGELIINHRAYSPAAAGVADIPCEALTTNNRVLHGVLGSSLDGLAHSPTAIIGIIFGGGHDGGEESSKSHGSKSKELHLVRRG